MELYTGFTFTAGPDTRRSTSDLPSTSRFSSDVSFSTIPRSKPAAAGPAPSGPADGERGYMPGMEKKKKKGLFSIFSRKKGGKFNVVCILCNYFSHRTSV